MPRQVKLRPAGELRGRDGIWAAIRRLRSCTVRRLADATRSDNGTVLRYLTGLAKAGYVKRTASRNRRIGDTWTLVRDCGVEAPRVRRDGTIPQYGDAIERVWRTMKVLGEFDAKTLALHASLADAPVSQRTVQVYLSRLKLAGYVVRFKAEGKRAPTFRFIRTRNTGPKPPRISQDGRVFDGNTGQLMEAQR